MDVQMLPRLVTLYGPRGEVVAQPTLYEVARAIDPPFLLDVVQALSEVNLDDGSLTPMRMLPVLVDQFGEPLQR